MIGMPNPLYDKVGNEEYPLQRILSDRGIRQALEQGLIKIMPELDVKDGRRIQPATLDVKIKEVTDFRDLKDPRHFLSSTHPLSLSRKGISVVNLTEDIDYYSFKPNNSHSFFSLSADCRSSLLRFGCFATLSGAVKRGFENSMEINMANFSPNTVVFEEGERIAQLFFRVEPFADTYLQSLRFGQKPTYTADGEVVRALDMGVEVIDPILLMNLKDKGFMQINRANGKHFEIDKHGRVLFHASNEAYRMREIPGGINFSRRKDYPDDRLLERINISKGYRIKPFEHIVCITEENFDLSPHVGVRGWDNLSRVDDRGRLLPHMIDMGLSRKEERQNFLLNMEMFPVTNSWVDPGYKGSFTRFPKFIGQVIRPGDVIGYGQVFYFPNGVERPYGAKDLGSQYQGQEKFQVAAK